MWMPRRHVVRHQRRHPDAEVDVVAVPQLPRHPPHDPLALVHGRPPVPPRCAGASDRSGLADRPPLDPLLVARALEDVLHEDARRDDRVGVERARLDELLDLGDRDRGRRRHHRVEVARGAAVDEVAEAVAPERLHEREVGLQRRLEHVVAPVDDARLLALGDDGAVAGRREEAADARRRPRGCARRTCPAGPARVRARRSGTGARTPGSRRRRSRSSCAPAATCSRMPIPNVVDAGVVADDGQVARAAGAQRRDQVLRDPAQPEAAHHDGRAVGNEGHGRRPRSPALCS